MTKTAPVATAQLTTTEAAVLALLAIEGERSGYDLLKLVSKAIAYVWAPARSQLYTVLARLDGDGLVHARTAREGRRPAKQLYRLSDAGRAALDEWLRAEPDSRDTFFLRLFVGVLVPREVLLGHLAWFRDQVTLALDEYRRIEPTNTRTGGDLYHHMLLRHAIERCEQELRWADAITAEIAAAA